LPDQFHCLNGEPQCIRLDQVSDGKINCQDGSDEGCPLGYFVCEDRSNCLEPKAYQDGQKDCPDGSDEPCSQGEFFCRDKSKCIDWCKFQDGIEDCADGSDEECTQLQFQCRCGMPRCIDLLKFNNSKIDCLDGSDEPLANGYLDDMHCARETISQRRKQHEPSFLVVSTFPCNQDKMKHCRDELNEICLIINGIPQCACRPGYIRLPYTDQCYMTNDAIWKSSPTVELIYDQKVSVSNFTNTSEANFCAMYLNNSCNGENEMCSKVNGIYGCSCKIGYARHPKSKLCIPLVDECADPKLNDCDPTATCMDNPISYECLCKEGYLDVSPKPRKYPGRKCIPLVDECKDTRTNDCDQNADCLDLPGGYTCQCREGFSDISPSVNQYPGRKCIPIKNECENKLDNDCSENAECLDTLESFKCRCKDGFIDRSPDPTIRPGRICHLIVDECKDNALNDCDKLNAECLDTIDSFVCRCKPGYIDLNPTNPGRKCSIANNPCLNRTLNDCDNHAICLSKDVGQYECACSHGFIDLSPDHKKPGRVCRQLFGILSHTLTFYILVIDECHLGIHHCDPVATCIDTPQSYTCVCPDNWLDVSDDVALKPGRRCQKRENECLDRGKNDCANDADCIDTEHGYLCHCRVGFWDVSLKYGKQPGRICQELRDECTLHYHDCSLDAVCIDTAESYLCRCKEGYVDISPNRKEFPGRNCSAVKMLQEDSSCKVDDPRTCNTDLFEVCLFNDGAYKCGCPHGVFRLPDGRCKGVNECKELKLNTCHSDAECIDQPESYTCQCRPGFVDASTDPENAPGRICLPLVNECNEVKKYKVDCDSDAICVDTALSYECRCKLGFVDVSEYYNKLPGRKCVFAVNECLDKKLHDCSEDAICEDAKEGYVCRCREGFVDVSPDVNHFPGRACILPKMKSSSVEISFIMEPCDPTDPKACHGAEICTEVNGNHYCRCPPHAERLEDGECKLLHACDDKQLNDCDKNAFCTNSVDSHSCQCKPDFIDVSDDPLNKPGRKCRQVVNECASPILNDCSPFAECVDTREGYACSCKAGYTDASSQFDLPPGRKCFNTTNECALRTLNTCDDSADCIDLPEGYACVCAPGYVDVSSSADLPPGRVCTIQTYCPTQPTDLMFVLDGSGSIGSAVFKNEILRFLREFINLFTIGSNHTRLAIIQYSDQIRHELDFKEANSKAEVDEALNRVEYLTGLTKTGDALTDMFKIGFSFIFTTKFFTILSESRGARPIETGVHRVAIVITDGRSQDIVSFSANEAKKSNVLMFAVGVTDHVSEAELVEIAGSKDRVFLVKEFTDLNVRLRSLIQKAACPPLVALSDKKRKCNLNETSACDASKNEICIVISDSFYVCDCPEGFKRHPLTDVCGGDSCNPEVKTSCPDPEICEKSPYGNYRCVCPDDYHRLPSTGFCVKELSVSDRKMEEVVLGCTVGDVSFCPKNEECVKQPSGLNECVCKMGLERNPKSDIPGACDPKFETSCDARRHEICAPDQNGNHICQCPKFSVRDPATQICLINECLAKSHDCDPMALCIDTPESYLCQCRVGYLDLSSDPKKSGRVCILKSEDHCQASNHNCSVNAHCINLAEGYICQCNPGFVDVSPNPRQMPGLDCREKRNECADPMLNDCSPNAICLDTDESYICVCKSGYTDKLKFSKPGRLCEKEVVNVMCSPGNNDCDPNAQCIPKGEDQFECICPSGYQDKSPNPFSRPGRVCLRTIPACDDPSLNDCDKVNAVCTETESGYTCSCKNGFFDISPNLSRPGRICKQLVNECLNGIHDCAQVGGICEDTMDSYQCRCAPGFIDISPDANRKPGRLCRQLKDECSTGAHDCSPDAKCIDTPDSFTCVCLPGFEDVSPNAMLLPGRSCLKLVNECESSDLNDCSPNAVCIDTARSYRCHCKEDFVDHSVDPLYRSGRICLPKKINECEQNQHDCSPNASCIDEDEGYTCRCLPGFVDRSDSPLNLPGRVCLKKPSVLMDSSCSISDVNSCDKEKNEICRIVNGQPVCVCPEPYQRNPDNDRCTVIDECHYPELNDCSSNAYCSDKMDGYTCLCKESFVDVSPNRSTRPGRVCKPLVDECAQENLHDCHPHAICNDLVNGYECRCKSGYVDVSANSGLLPGRVCHKAVDECADPNLNTCDRNAACFDDLFGYRCQCLEGYLDISPVPTNPGRACKKIVNECETGEHDCDPSAACIDTLDFYKCLCPADSEDVSPNPAFPGRVCRRAVDECQSGLHDCDKNADCLNTDASFSCKCHEGFLDRSPNSNRPGRFCVKLVDECAEGIHLCSPNAHCRDLQDGYTCECKDGFVDRSPVSFQPGRICTRPDVCPPNHDCSPDAICEPLPDGSYTCQCIPGYVDQSSNGKQGRHCVRANECRDRRLNDCSENALCIKLTQGYSCECMPGFTDHSPDAGKYPGRICDAVKPSFFPQTKHPCQDPNLNDCSLLGSCRGSSTHPEGYTCECPSNYADWSPDPVQKPGRICVRKIPACLDPTKNDCHNFAICQETSTDEGYSCRCRDGYVDTSPDMTRLGRMCQEKLNECLDANLNNCASTAICEDADIGYNCRCPAGYLDQSPDPNQPVINECESPLMNNCSRFAICIDKAIGFECQCKDGYYDSDPLHPGRVCTLILYECDSINLNDCDRHAICEDIADGYKCTCIPPYEDHSPDPDKPGRVCRVNECEHPTLNDCDQNAICQNTDDSYICYCKEGFVDESDNPLKPGRKCVKQTIPEIITSRPITLPPDLIPCGSQYCNITLEEYCVGGTHCDCRPGFMRENIHSLCESVLAIDFPLRVIRREETPLYWSNVYGNPEDPHYIEIKKLFIKGISNAVRTTELAPLFVTADVKAITPPLLYNASWSSGLVFNYTVYLRQGSKLSPEIVWDYIMSSIKETDYSIGGTELYIDPIQINPFEIPIQPTEILCGDKKCNEKLGEICFGDKICSCPIGEGRKESSHPCKTLESFILPLLVARRGDTPLLFSKLFNDPSAPEHIDLVNLFIKGVDQAYRITNIWPYYINSEVIQIEDPLKFKFTNKSGSVFNFTVHFEKGTVNSAQTAWNELYYSAVSTNYSLGGTELYLNQLQPDPFDPCQWNQCHPVATCIAVGIHEYTCQCPAGYKDVDPSLPGRKCQRLEEFNECLDPSTNNCSPNAICIDLPKSYKCECKPGFIDISPPGSKPGTVCIVDYCADVPFCPINTTCVNLPELQGARCECQQGFVDIRNSPFIKNFIPNTYCIAERDVDECVLGLTNCSSVAECVNLDVGYTCKCPAGYADGNPSLPGRICAAASCSTCNDHGDCIHEPGRPEPICKCHPWFTGERCDTDMRVVLLIVFAVIFFLITLCCLLYFCLKCHCVRKRSLWYREPLLAYRRAVWPWSTMDASTSSESNAAFSAVSASPFVVGKSADPYADVTIPRAKLKPKSSLDSFEPIDTSHLHAYLDVDQMRMEKIPRAHLSGVEREGSGSIVYSDVHGGLYARQGRTNGYLYSEGSVSGSSDFSESTFEEEIVRRVKNVKRTEIRKTVKADVHEAVTDASESADDEITESTAKDYDNRTLKSTSSFGGTYRSVRIKFIFKFQEVDCGRSVIEVNDFSVSKNNQSKVKCSAATTSIVKAAQDQEDRDVDSISVETTISNANSNSTVTESVQDTYDKKVLLKKSCEYFPR
ncbi:Transmembrane cell adhesion receptor mua-3, partial [Trichinella papuae]